MKDDHCNGTIRLKLDNKWGRLEVETGKVVLPFLYDESVTINVLVLEKKDNPSLTAITFNTHTTSELDEVHLQLGEDGLYNLIHIVVPTYDWYIRNKKLGTLSKYK